MISAPARDMAVWTSSLDDREYEPRHPFGSLDW
jgi:hypothetical protein